jgi:hypothetical protein
MLFQNKSLCVILLVLFSALFSVNEAKSQEISSYLLGNNAWYDGYGLNPLWDDMALANFKTIRIGGATAEGYSSTNTKFITLIDGIRLAKAEPIVQVSRTWTDQQVKDFITHINITKAKNIKFWSIGNEPDHPNRPSTIEEVYTYIKRISSALKSVDPTIKVFGPETAGFNSTTYITRFLGGDLDISGKDNNGNYYIDVYTWHRYMFSDIYGLETDVNTFLSRVNTVNATRPAGQKISWGLTEFNTSYDNSKNSSPDMNVWSFHAGQTFAEVYGLGMRKGAFCMTAWSMLEGEVERVGTDLSLFDKDLKPRANYYHCLMLGQNMKKNYITTTDNKGNIVVIPMQDETGTAVMILNKDHASSFEYTLRLNNDAYISSKTLLIKVNGGIDKEIYGTIDKQATQMLVFDNTGTLIKRYTYTTSDADFRVGPLVETISTDPVPTVNFTLPVNNSTISLKTAVNLEATASDNGTVKKVEFTANGSLIGTSTNPPYKFTWTPTMPGTFKVSARAFDDLGGVGFASESVELIVERVINYVPIPATIEAEAYDGMLGIMLGTTTDVGGGQNVGYCEVADWMDYPIIVPKAGQYQVDVRVASLNATGAFDLMIGTKILASYALNPGTGGWQTWTTLSKTVSLSAGNQMLRLIITGKDININWLKFSAVTSSTVPELNQIKIYPNPVSKGEFQVVLKSNSENEPIRIELFNLSGQKIFSQNQIVHNSGIVNVKLNKNTIPESGLYLVSVQSKAGKYMEKLLFKK